MGNSGVMRGSHGFIGVMIITFVFGLALTSLITSQYSAYYLQTHLFPNSTDPTTLNRSSCMINKSTEEYHERTVAQMAASRLDIYAAVTETGPALITLGIMGTLSDRFGRNKILIVNLSCCLLAFCVSSTIIYFKIDVYYFLISSTLYSIGGGLYGALSLGFAYISDVTSPGKQRTLMITLLEASIGIGGATSDIASGFIIKNVGFFNANLCACAAAVTSVLVVVLFLPYSRPAGDTNVPYRTASEHISASFAFYFRASPKRYKYVLGITLFMVASLSILGKPPIEVLFQRNVPFCWSPVNEGYFSGISLASKMVLGVAIIKVLQLFFAEEVIAILSGISGMTASIVEAFATNDATLFAGALFAGIAVVEIASSLASNVGAPAIYMATVGTMRGFTFLIFAGLSFLVIILLLIYRVKVGGSKTVPIADVTKDIPGTQVVSVDIVAEE